jgi:hypothetical protein
MANEQIRIGKNDGLAGAAQGGGWQFAWNSLPGTSPESQAAIEGWISKNVQPPQQLILNYETTVSFNYGTPG